MKTKSDIPIKVLSLGIGLAVLLTGLIGFASGRQKGRLRMAGRRPE